MAVNEYVNKVVLADGRTLIDLTTDDVTRAHVLSTAHFHLPTGERTTGTCTYDADTSDATAGVAEILADKTAYRNGTKLTGTMPNRGGVTGTLILVDQEYTIPAGYHDGSGKVSISSTDQAKIIADNIRQGVTILGVEGTMTGSENVHATTLEATPYFDEQEIVPQSPYNYFSQVNIAAIEVVETDNLAGGKTIVIGAVPPEPEG